MFYKINEVISLLFSTKLFEINILKFEFREWLLSNLFGSWRNLVEMLLAFGTWLLTN